jgi:hypothetical protein
MVTNRPIGLHDFTDGLLAQHFRFKRWELEDMTAADHPLALPREFEVNRVRHTGLEGWLALLYRLKFPVRLVDMQQIFRRHYTQLCKLIRAVVAWFTDTHGHLLTSVGMWVPHMQVGPLCFATHPLPCPIRASIARASPMS